METEDSPEQAIVRAIGEELRRARMTAGWTRPELIRRMRTQIPVNTYAGYEQGIRQCSIPRLVEICQALDVSTPHLIGLALQRVGLDPDTSGEEAGISNRVEVILRQPVARRTRLRVAGRR